MARKIDIPQFKFPFDFSEVEQDSQAEITDCCEVVLRTVPESLIDLPEFGTPDQTFSEGSANIPEIVSALRRWEPRASFAADDEGVEDTVQTIQIRMKERNDA